MKEFNRRDFIRYASIGVGAVAAKAPISLLGEERRRRKPNILIILTDQQTLKAMSAYGNKWVCTPHMDSIAANGVRFENSYCTSPVCGPSRSSLVTGRMPHETGVIFNGQSIRPGIQNMGEIFRKAGYKTAWAGKWHLPQSYPRGKNATIPRFEYLAVPEGTKFGLGSQTDGPVADEAIKFLLTKHEEPFVLGVSLHNPHDICWWVREKPVKHPDLHRFPPLPNNFNVAPDEPEFIQMCRERTYYGEEIQWTKSWDKDQWRAYLNAYYRLTEEADKEIGRILAALREQGLEEHTLVIFTSDHGEGMAAHRWVVKLMLYEEPVTVPLIVSWKGVTPAGAVDKKHLVSGIDVLPTICDYAGVRGPQMTGISLKPLIENPSLPGHAFVVSELSPDPKDLDRKGRMVRTQRYKYIVFSMGRNPEMLFDLENDQGEAKNLAHDSTMKDVLERHRMLLRNWMEQTNDDVKMPVSMACALGNTA
ncbi:sulfatase-like hydrolase/transferase [bacterium]|nr:sulfatase-like hydrolase/transferase [bacterium]